MSAKRNLFSSPNAKNSMTNTSSDPYNLHQIINLQHHILNESRIQSESLIKQFQTLDMLHSEQWSLYVEFDSYQGEQARQGSV